MKTKLGFFLLCIVGMLFLYPQNANADMGAKPTMSFSFQYEQEVKDIVLIKGRLFECEDSECSISTTFEEFGPQRFECEQTGCFSQAYDYTSQYYKLLVEFSDGTRESNVFENKRYNSTYLVTVDDSTLFVEFAPWQILLVRNNFLSLSHIERSFVALIVTILVEMIVAGFCLLFLKIPARNLGWFLVATLLSLPLLWIFSFTISSWSKVMFLASELLVICFEAGFVYWVTRKAISLKSVLLVSFIANLVSFFVGWWL